MTTAEWFEQTLGKLKEHPEAVEGIKGTFQFDYTSDDNGVWHMCFPGDGTYDIGAGGYPEAAVKVVAKWENMWKIMNGELNANVAMMTGKMKFKGDMGVAMQLGKLTAL
jgi:putative sterol carrier protein